MKILINFVLGLIIIACNSNGGGSGSSSTNIVKIEDGIYTFSNTTTVGIHLTVSNSGANYTMGFLSIGSDEYVIETGPILYNGSTSIFVPASYIPSNCGYKTGMAGQGEWEFSQTSGYLTLQPTGNNESPITWFFEDYNSNIATFMGQTATPTCWI
jgi:hypothetical protein